jgi:1,4-dihydroxy-2-naphthoyl-CoA hydrolase
MINTSYSLEQINKMNEGNMLGFLGMEFTEITADSLSARMPVNERTHQPFGLLHGGASVALAESLGSTAAWLCLGDPEKQIGVGVEINANHLKSVRSGYVYGKCTPLRIGRTLQVWEIKITNEKQELVCASRLTVAIVDRK